MKAVALFAVLVIASSPVLAKGGSHSVRGHVTKTGTYVQPHMATNRNATKMDNYSTKGNTNPYTSKAGVKKP